MTFPKPPSPAHLHPRPPLRGGRGRGFVPHPDQLTDLTLALTAAEVTREKLFLRIHDEIPYNSTVETERFQIQQDGSYRIDQVIYVTRDQHKKIVLGVGGQTIKSIGADSRAELIGMFDTPVHLFLFVKVREKWGDDPERYREMGLDYGQ